MSTSAQFYHSPKPALKAHLLLLALAALPLIINVPANVNVVLLASVCVYAACWRSVKAEPPTESMTKHDAMRFPIVGSCVLFGLFLAFKFLPKWLVNLLLTAYIGVIAVLVLANAVLPYVSDLFPAVLNKLEFTLPKIKIPHVIDLAEEPVTLTATQIIIGLASGGFCSWYLAKKHWFANNILGLALSLEGIEHLSLGSVHVGCILLVGLFFYDIFWVFCTPVMVSVAKNFDAPIKLLFPRPLDDTGKRPFSMLGLGDIVIPGIFVALMLRMDVSRNMTSGYFRSAFAGYVLGLAATIVVMNVFNAAQPALLYLVPSILGCVGVHAWSKKEFMLVFNYSEAVEETSDKKAEDKDTKKDK